MCFLVLIIIVHHVRKMNNSGPVGECRKQKISDLFWKFRWSNSDFVVTCKLKPVQEWEEFFIRLLIKQSSGVLHLETGSQTRLEFLISLMLQTIEKIPRLEIQRIAKELQELLFATKNGNNVKQIQSEDWVESFEVQFDQSSTWRPLHSPPILSSSSH